MPVTTRKRQQPLVDAMSRPRKRLQNGAPRTRTGAAMSPDEPMDHDETLCTECRKINLDEIFGKSLRKVNGEAKNRQFGRSGQKIWLRLDGRIPSPTSMDHHYELCTLRAKKRFGATRAADIVDTTALIVRPKYHSDESVEERIILEDLPQEPNKLSARCLAPQVNTCIRLVGEWLAFCDKHHSTCKDPDLPIPRGFRVLDCVGRKILEWDRICDRGNNSQETVPSRIRRRGRLQAVKVPQPLPRTIEDAVSLTQSLGCRYLWVGRYCIPQDDPIAKHLQLRGMDVIYQHAFFTIIAAAGDNPHHGLPGVRDTPRNAQPQFTVGSRTLISVPLVKRKILKPTWNSRGWTYQECLLSRRKVVFTDSQVYYQCNAMHCVEGIRAPLESLHVLNRSRMSDQVNMSRAFPLRIIGKESYGLEALVTEYLHRSLTFENDILDAFRGVLAAHERRFSANVKTLAGIPISVRYLAGNYSKKQALCTGMSWFFHTNKGKSCILKLERRPGFPSWTWLGWKFREALSITLRRQMTNKSVAIDVWFQYADRRVLHWETQHDLIIARGSEGEIPCFLCIEGDFLQVQVDMDGELTEDKNNLLRYLSQLSPKRRQSAYERFPYAWRLAVQGDQDRLTQPYMYQTFAMKGGQHVRNPCKSPEFVLKKESAQTRLVRNRVNADIGWGNRVPSRRLSRAHIQAISTSPTTTVHVGISSLNFDTW
ncbi:tol protein [Rhypophila sp. PSN 637]